MKIFSSYHSFVILRLFLSDNKFQFHRLMYERKIPVDLDWPFKADNQPYRFKVEIMHPG